MEAHPAFRGGIPPITSAEDEARQAQFTTYDYGRVGDQRPYQVVMPAYGAPQFLKTFMNLEEGLRECKTLCTLQGRPFRLMRWGSSVSCVPCGRRNKTNRLPRGIIQSSGALPGYPEAQPIAEAHPRYGVILYGPRGYQTMIGYPNYKISRQPYPPSGFYNPGKPAQHYLTAVKSAQYMATHAGRRTYVCASFGAPCKKRSKKWYPVVYVDPGGLVSRYGDGEVPLGPNATTTYGSTSVSTPVSPDEFTELIEMSKGRTLLGQGY